VYQDAGVDVCTGPVREIYLGTSQFLPRSGDDVLLRSADGVCRDYLAYEVGAQINPAPADCIWAGPNPGNGDVEGVSLARDDRLPFADDNDGSDWEPSGSFLTLGPITPGGPNFVPADADGDGVPDPADNCPATPNANQADGDGDGQGDVCDPCPVSAVNDIDGDGLCGDTDNCPLDANPLQEDFDGDTFGDVCDNCPTTFNSTQDDGDGDGRGRSVRRPGRRWDLQRPGQLPHRGQPGANRRRHGRTGRRL